MSKIKLAYMGSPDFSADLLKMIVEDSEMPVEVTQVVTQPAARVGRKQIITPTPVEEYARAQGIPVWTYTRRGGPVAARGGGLGFLEDVDVVLVFAFGEIIPSELLEAPKYGFWNVHPSILPKYRGPSPVAGALLEGATETGVTIMKMDAQMDHGPILAQQPVYIFPVWRRDQLTKHLVEQGYGILKNLFMAYQEDLNKAPLIQQNHEAATYTKLMNKDDGYISSVDFHKAMNNPQLAREIFDKFRAYYPWPGIWTRISIGGIEKRLKITKIHWEDDRMVIKRVQLEGKTEVDYEQFSQAYPDQALT